MKNTKILSEPYNGLSFLLLALLWFGSIGAWPLQETTEARYGLVAQEMLLSGDWLTLTLTPSLFLINPQYTIGDQH